MFAHKRTSRRSAATKLPIDIFNGDFEMRILSMIAITGAMIARLPSITAPASVAGIAIVLKSCCPA
jgi:hypothetical protein